MENALDDLTPTEMARQRVEMQIVIDGIASKLGSTPGDVLRRPHFSREASLLNGAWPIAEKLSANKVYEHFGGRRTLKNAHSLEQTLKELREANTKGSMFGIALYLAASIAHHHKDLSPSLTRAYAIMTVGAAAGDIAVTSGKSNFLRQWGKWRGAAPLYAALLLHMRHTREIYMPRLGDAEIDRMVLAPHSIRQILSWATWLTNWATTTIAPNSKDPYIPPAEAIHIHFPGLAEVPPLRELNDMQLFAARQWNQPAEAEFEPKSVYLGWRKQKG
ncbi:hypothetical protein [Pseudoroseomonas sp. WGS1072]|uniref:hypothetical protein n=1 Tax=Roseomonas sp. WGS1072 TaxID=3366816 RepID=UPI003BF43001